MYLNELRPEVKKNTRRAFSKIYRDPCGSGCLMCRSAIAKILLFLTRIYYLYISQSYIQPEQAELD